MHVGLGSGPGMLHAVGPGVGVKIAGTVHAVDGGTVQNLANVMGALDLLDCGPSVGTEASRDFLKIAPEVMVGPPATGEMGPTLAQPGP